MKTCIPIFFLLAVYGCRAADTKEHPLTPLTEHEIANTVEVLRALGKINSSTIFPEIALREPDKQAVLASCDGPREAFAVVYDRATNKNV